MTMYWFVFVCIAVWLSEVTESYSASSLSVLLQQHCNRSSVSAIHCHSGLSSVCVRF